MDFPSNWEFVFSSIEMSLLNKWNNQKRETIMSNYFKNFNDPLPIAFDILLLSNNYLQKNDGLLSSQSLFSLFSITIK